MARATYLLGTARPLQAEALLRLCGELALQGGKGFTASWLIFVKVLQLGQERWVVEVVFGYFHFNVVFYVQP
jgi:hypothetical protein